MNISSYQDQKICAVRFRHDASVLTVYQFEFWFKLNSSEVFENALDKISFANADPVYESEAPSVTEGQLAEWDGAVEIGGKWYRNWKIVEDAEKPNRIGAAKLSDVRRARDALLVASDWTQFTDSPLSALEKAEWADYRQKLRDITTQNIDAIIWPTQPIKAG